MTSGRGSLLFWKSPVESAPTTVRVQIVKDFKKGKMNKKINSAIEALHCATGLCEYVHKCISSVKAEKLSRSQINDLEKEFNKISKLLSIARKNMSN